MHIYLTRLIVLNIMLYFIKYDYLFRFFLKFSNIFFNFLSYFNYHLISTIIVQLFNNKILCYV